MGDTRHASWSSRATGTIAATVVMTLLGAARADAADTTTVAPRNPISDGVQYATGYGKLRPTTCRRGIAGVYRFVRVENHGVVFGAQLWRWTLRVEACRDRRGRVVWARARIGHHEGGTWAYAGLNAKDGNDTRAAVWRYRRGQMNGSVPLTGAVVDHDYPWASITLGYDGRRWWSTWRHGCLDC